MSSSNSSFLTCIRDFSGGRSGGLIFPSLEEFSTVCCDAHSLRLWHKAKYVFLKLSCFCDDPVDVGNLNSGSYAFYKSSLNIWMFTFHILLNPGLENFEYYLLAWWDECNCAVVWRVFGIAFLQDWNENWLFPVLWPLMSFPNLLAYWVQRFHSTISDYKFHINVTGIYIIKISSWFHFSLKVVGDEVHIVFSTF